MRGPCRLPWESSSPAPVAGRTGGPLRSSRSRPSSLVAPMPTERGVTPSMPAVRAPLLPRTRRHATVRNAGSYTRLNTSSKRRPGSTFAQWCSFVCIASTRASASSRLGHGAPVFTGDLLGQCFGCVHAGPLRHVAGFPDRGLLRVLRPIPPASTGDGPSHPPSSDDGEGPTGWFPRSLANRSTGSAPSYAPAASPRLRRRPSPWPPGRRYQPAKEFPDPWRGMRCSAAVIHQVQAAGSLEGRSAAGFSTYAFPSR